MKNKCLLVAILLISNFMFGQSFLGEDQKEICIKVIYSYDGTNVHIKDMLHSDPYTIERDIFIKQKPKVISEEIILVSNDNFTSTKNFELYRKLEMITSYVPYFEKSDIYDN